MKKNRGITLIEMIVVMSIIIIFTAASIPSFVNFTKTARLRAAARDITTALRSARRYAITTRISRDVTVYLYDYTVDSLKNAVSFYETGSSIETQRAAANVYFTDDTPAAELTFTFTPRGTTTGDTITVAEGSSSRYINITVLGATGRVKIGDIEQ